MAVNQGLINHIALVIDASSSIEHRRLTQAIATVADNHIKHLASRSQELNQETRVTVYTFADQPECLFYDKDALRLPSVAEHYWPHGNTALIAATLKAIEDLEKTATLYGDHSFLIFILTDGEENCASPARREELPRRIASLKDNWTLACFVPDQMGVHAAKQHGFPAANVQVWDTSAKGMSEVGEKIRAATDQYMQGRARGVKGSKNLFELDLAALKKSDVNRQLIKKALDEYRTLKVTAYEQIHELVSRETGKPYSIGSAYYQLTKKETVQADKDLALREKSNGCLYTGAHARTLLGIPDGADIKLVPALHPDYEIFIQSKSVNRKVIPGTDVILP